MAPRPRRLAPPMGRERRIAAFAEYRATTDPERQEALETELARGHERFCWREARRYEQQAEMDDLFSVALAAFVFGVVRRYGRGFNAEVNANNDAWLHYAELVVRRELRAYVNRHASSFAVPRHAGKLAEVVHAGEDAHEVLSFDPQEEIAQTDNAEEMNRAVALLPDRQAHVVRMRFGLDGIAPHELAEIGAVIGVSKQRVEAILKQALGTLRRSLEPTRKAA